MSEDQEPLTPLAQPVSNAEEEQMAFSSSPPPASSPSTLMGHEEPTPSSASLPSVPARPPPSQPSATIAEVGDELPPPLPILVTTVNARRFLAMLGPDSHLIERIAARELVHMSNAKEKFRNANNKHAFLEDLTIRYKALANKLNELKKKILAREGAQKVEAEEMKEVVMATRKDIREKWPTLQEQFEAAAAELTVAKLESDKASKKYDEYLKENHLEINPLVQKLAVDPEPKGMPFLPIPSASTIMMPGDKEQPSAMAQEAETSSTLASSSQANLDDDEKLAPCDTDVDDDLPLHLILLTAMDGNIPPELQANFDRYSRLLELRASLTLAEIECISVVDWRDNLAAEYTDLLNRLQTFKNQVGKKKGDIKIKLKAERAECVAKRDEIAPELDDAEQAVAVAVAALAKVKQEEEAAKQVMRYIDDQHACLFVMLFKRKELAQDVREGKVRHWTKTLEL